ncbi:uncharacterized protein G2W53_004194 [Senna tora]|uniref:Uncharacterized protein n=1 Tax=Senna tora TaxID=362788 RepID=A0A834XCJ8_9FABA|nr:uncharacterized protein G2W53_004194 [Senna tora]
MWCWIRTLSYIPLCSSPISQPSSSGNSNGPPKQPVVQDDELLIEVPTGLSQQQGTTGSASVDSSTIIPQGRDPTDGKTWIQPCGQSDARFRGLMSEVREDWEKGKRPVWVPEE